MTAVLILFSVLYPLWIVRLAYRWKSARNVEHTSESPSTGVTIVIPFRNEAENLPLLIESLNAQKGDLDHVEIIFVDDHSTDHGKKAIAVHLPFSVLNLSEENGKKAALHAGILRARYEWIITLDADVRIAPFWLKDIQQAIIEHESDMIILPLAIEEGETIFQKMQCLEFMSVLGVTGGTAMQGNPLLCNGGNLAFRKKKYFDVMPLRQDRTISSGDDVFFLHALKKQGKISWLHSTSALAWTAPCARWSSFYSQRVRWSSKSSHFTDPKTKIFGAFILVANLLVLIGLIATSLLQTHWMIFTLFLVTKFFADLLLVSSVASWLDKKNVLMYFVFLWALYPLYFILVVCGSLFFTPQWKGRRISLSTTKGEE